MRWTEHVAHMGESGGAFRVLVGKPEGRRPLRRPSRRWDDYSKMDFREVGWRHGLYQCDSGKVTVCCECGNEPSGSIKCMEFLD